jgi:hypothetical protein
MGHCICANAAGDCYKGSDCILVRLRMTTAVGCDTKLAKGALYVFPASDYLYASLCTQVSPCERFSTQKSMRHLSFIEPSGDSGAARPAVRIGGPPASNHPSSRHLTGSLAFALVCKAEPGTAYQQLTETQPSMQSFRSRQ